MMRRTSNRMIRFGSCQSAATPARRYDFDQLADELARAMESGAEDLTAEVQELATQARANAADIRGNASAMATALNELNVKLRDFGTTLLEAQRKYNGGG